MGTYIKNVSGIDPNAISMTVNQTNSLFKQNQAYLNTPEVYQALNIHNSSKNGSLFQNINAEAAEAIEYQMLNSSLEYIDYLLTQIPCLIYDGAFDIEFGPAGTFTWLSQLNPPYNKILNVRLDYDFNVLANKKYLV